MVTVASLLQNHRLSGSLDSSRDLQPIYTKNFVNRLYLVLYACVKTFDVTVFLRLQGLWGGN